MAKYSNFSKSLQLLEFCVNVIQSAKPGDKLENSFPHFWHHWFQHRVLHIWICNRLFQNLIEIFWSGIIYQIQVFKNIQFEVELVWELDFKISQLQNIIQNLILGQWGPNFWQKMQYCTKNEQKGFPT